jgi:hypothetical protein
MSDESGICAEVEEESIWSEASRQGLESNTLSENSRSIGFIQSDIDECLFYKGSAVFVLYTDDSILAGPDECELNEIVEEMSRSGLKLTIEGELSDFLECQD